MQSIINQLWNKSTKRSGAEEFKRQFKKNLETCSWRPHPLYSVFTQYDQESYLAHEAAFKHKYRCFYAVSKTIAPKSIIELGVSAGSSADAYLSASPNATYIGIDIFGVGYREDNGLLWDPQQTAIELFSSRGFKNWKLIKRDLRLFQELPAQAEMVVVDAAHDFDNQYADMKLALTANPSFIFVDDANENEVKPAINRFLSEDVAGRVDFVFRIDYTGGGLVIKLAK